MRRVDLGYLKEEYEERFELSSTEAIKILYGVELLFV